MANTTVYPYGTDGQLPSSIGIVDDLTTGGHDQALSAEMGKVLNGRMSVPYDLKMVNGNLVRRGGVNIGGETEYECTNFIDVSAYAELVISTNLHRSATEANDVCVCAYDEDYAFVANILDPHVLSNVNGTVEVTNYKYSVASGVKYIRVPNKKAGSVIPSLVVALPEQAGRVSKNSVEAEYDLSLPWVLHNSNTRKYAILDSIPKSITWKLKDPSLYDIGISGTTNASASGYFSATFDSGWQKDFKDFQLPEGLAVIRLAIRAYNDGNISTLDVQSVTKELKAVCAQPIIELSTNGSLVADTALQNQSDFILHTMAQPTANIKTVSHRGFSSIAPENTMPAFIMSYKRGFRYIETDVAFTSDGVAVLLHDATINRTARNADGTAISGTVNIADITYEQALEYDFGIWMGADYAGTKIPTLNELCLFCKATGMHPYIELKSTLADEKVPDVVAIVNSYGLRGKVTYTAGTSAKLSIVKSLDDRARLGYVYNYESTASIVAAIIELRTQYNEVFYSCSDRSTASINRCKEANIPYEVWTIDSKDVILGLDPYISSVVSNSLNASQVLSEQFGL